MCRFYFVSDPTLLEILSLGSDPPSVVPHFQSGLFDSLSNATFDKVRSCRPRVIRSAPAALFVTHCNCKAAKLVGAGSQASAMRRSALCICRRTAQR